MATRRRPLATPTQSTLAAPTLADAQAAGFPVGGEPLALDLADTLITVSDPPLDLLADDARARQFWTLQRARLPAGAAAPDLAATRALRGAIRALLEARLGAREPSPDALDTLNAAAASAPGSPRLVVGVGGLAAGWRWHTEDGQALSLATTASSAIDVLTGQAERLRRCANPGCSMLFLADSARRQWCTPNICGNRARVARHYRRHRTAPGSMGSANCQPA
ncbi:MAG TPA: ABATE domain-containing protein [Chloroflexota bacterium]|nr:ABATE domain-containing protein [Chloroflexota bacterium]